jgi:hypothetical protein
MTRVGTCHFVNHAMAVRYYRSQGFETVADAIAAVDQRLRDAEIFLGQPPLKHGDRLLAVDNGTRYAIEFNEKE